MLLILTLICKRIFTKFKNQLSEYTRKTLHLYNKKKNYVYSTFIGYFIFFSLIPKNLKIIMSTFVKSFKLFINKYDGYLLLR